MDDSYQELANYCCNTLPLGNILAISPESYAYCITLLSKHNLITLNLNGSIGSVAKNIIRKARSRGKKENLYIHNLGTQSVHESSILGQPIWDWVIV